VPKRVLDVILVIALFATPVLVLSLPHSGIMESERRLAAPFPSPSLLQILELKEFFRQADAFSADRFPLRDAFLRLSSAAYGAMEASQNSENCFRGKDDWLFLGNNFSGFTDKFRGVVTMSPELLESQTARYVRLRDMAASRGADFLLIVGPQKMSVYPEFLPLYIIPAPRRYITPLVESLERAKVVIVEPTERLIAAKPPSAASETLYYRTDSHWNLKGAHVAFEAFREKAGLPPLPPFTFASLPPERGDLADVSGFSSFPLHEGDNFEPLWDPPLPVTQFAETSSNPSAPSPKSVWVFGDSATHSLAPYFQAMFREVRFFVYIQEFHADLQETFDREMASDLPGPDLVVWVTSERGFGYTADSR
jgi:hypothetical protein